jgi:raffinose/stachyose/melibiose transport system substrate-binding protein
MKTRVFVVFLAVLAATGMSFASGQKDKGATAGPVELSWWTINVDEKGTYEPMIAAFEKSHPSIKIVPGWIETTAYIPALKAALAAGKGPDVFQGWPESQISVFARNGQAMDITRQAADWKVYPNLLGTYKDKVYSVPSGIGMLALYYNKEIFQKYGLAIPQTVADISAMADKLKKDLIVPLAYGSGDDWNADKVWFALAGQTAGDEVLKKADRGEVAWTIPELVQPMEIMVEMRDRGCFPEGFQGMNWQDVKNVFYQKKAAMWLFGNWQIQIFKDENVAKTKNNPDGLDIGVIPFPKVDNSGKYRPNTSGHAGPYWVVNQEGKHKKEALDLVGYFCAGEGLTLYVSAYKLPPGPFDMSKITSFEDPYLSLQEFFAKASPTMTNGNLLTPEVAQELVVQIQGVNNKMTTPQKAMQALQKVSESAKR